MLLNFGPCAICGAPCDYPGDTAFLSVTIQPSAVMLNNQPRLGETERFAVCEPCSKRPVALDVILGAVHARTREVA